MLQSELLHSKLGQSKILQEHIEDAVTHDADLTDTSDFVQSPNHYKEAMQCMKLVLDYWTHLKYYSIPTDPALTVFVTAKEDKYVPREWAEDVRELWPGRKNYFCTLSNLGVCQAVQFNMLMAAM